MTVQKPYTTEHTETTEREKERERKIRLFSLYFPKNLRELCVLSGEQGSQP
jgi:hypothetical protein